MRQLIAWRRLIMMWLLISLISVMGSACADENAVKQRVADLEAAMWTGDIAQAKQVLANGPIPAATSENLCWLHFAIARNEPKFVRPLVNAGVPVDCKYVGMTALQAAIKYNRYQVADELILAGADVNKRTPGESGSGSNFPLNDAAQEYVSRRVRGLDASKSKRLVQQLLEHGADPNRLDEPDAPSALCIAAEQGQTDMVRLLINGGANTSQVSDKGPDKKGVTALECALLRDKSNMATVKSLLNAGADPTAGPHADELLEKTEQNMPQAMPLLKQYGAR